MKKQLVASTLMLSCMAYAGGKMVQPTEPIKIKDKKDFFTFAAGGGAFFGGEFRYQKTATFTKGVKDDKSAMFEVGLGYNFSENIFTELAYQRSMLDIADVDSGYLSLNYQFSNIMLNPYIGILGGYSRLKWSERPYIMLANGDLTSTSFLYGAQTGISLPLADALSLTAKYQYMKLDHVMNIRNGANTIKHNGVQNLLLGVKYEF